MRDPTKRDPTGGTPTKRDPTGGDRSSSDSIRRHLKQKRPFGTLEIEVFVGMHVAVSRLLEPWVRYLREHGDLTEVQFNVLRVLRGARPRGLRVQELGERLIARNPDVTRLVNRLERRGLVERVTDEADRRAVRVHISPAGLETLAPLDAPAAEFLVEVLAPMDRGRLELLRDLVGELLDVIEPIEPVAAEGG